MAKVTGSKQYPLEVRVHRPGRTWRRRFLALIGLALLGAGSFFAGQFMEQRQQVLEPGERQQLLMLKEQLTMSQRDGMVDRVAVENSIETIVELEAEVHRLNKAVAFYKGIIAPENNVKGLSVQRFDLNPSAEPGRYSMDWVLAQIGKNDKQIQGKLSVRLLGFNGEEQVEIDLNDLAVEPINTAFKFQYFQNFSVDLRVDAGLKLEKVVVVATTAGKKPKTVTKEFDWLVQEESIANAGE